MTVYFVYRIIDTGKNKEGGDILRPLLYGYTKSKKILKQFKKERDMNQFHIVEKEFDEDEFIIFESHNKTQRIDSRKYVTYRRDLIGYVKDYVEITSTEYEEEKVYTSSDSAIFEAGKYTKYPEYIFNKDIQKALKNLDYQTIKRYSQTKYDTMYPLFVVGDRQDDIQIDMFYIFMYLYGSTMRKDD